MSPRSDNPDGLISQLSSDAKKRYFVMFMEFGTLICGLLCLAAGVMGIYWGSAVIKPWPPLTWNNCVGGFFMVVFGTAMACLGLAGFSKAASGNETGGEQAGMITREAKFLDVFAGRGVFFIYLAIRLMTLGKYYCLMAGLGLFFFGIANIVVHGFVIIGAKNACKQLNYVSAVIGLIVMVAGGMGFYWGTKVIKPWPPLTWNNCVGGIFMFFFGLVVLYICMKGDDPNAVMLQKYFRFLDTFIGRGCFFMFVGLRIIPLGQFYCLVAGMVTFSFGVLNVALHYLYPEVIEDGDRGGLANYASQASK
jgi:hypothetical protein